MLKLDLSNIYSKLLLKKIIIIVLLHFIRKFRTTYLIFRIYTFTVDYQKFDMNQCIWYIDNEFYNSKWNPF